MIVDTAKTSILEFELSRPQFLAIRTKLVALFRRKIRIVKVDSFVASRMLDGPLPQLAPVPAFPRLPNAGYEMPGRGLLVFPSSVSWSIIGVAHDVLPKKVDAVRDVTTRQRLRLTVKRFERGLSE